jgi:hypothetical protein
MLDLTYEPSNGVYLAPIQMQANNGVLVIDDFGRQLMTPEELLNRWIVPLDRRIDYLSLSYGVRFEIPFDCKVVFSTNLEPAALGDEAFFRRIQNKILVPSIADQEFDIVLHRAANTHEVELAPGAEEYLRQVSREQGDGDLRPYLPIEVCKILKSISQYFNVPRVLNTETIDRIAAIYFTHAMRGAPPPSLLTTLVQEDERARESAGSPAPGSNVQQATTPEAAQLQRRQAAPATATPGGSPAQSPGSTGF